MTISSFVFILVFLVAHAIFAYRVKILFKLAQATKGPTWSGSRFDRTAERIQTFIANVIGQKAVLRKKSAGIMHAAIFWGFIIITLETVENFGRELYADFSFAFIGHSAYGALVFVQDLFTGVVLAAVLYAFYRRLVLKPEGLGKSKDAIIVLIFTGGLMVALLVMRAFRIYGAPEEIDSFMLIGNFLSQVFVAPLNMDTEMAANISVAFRWLHHFLVLGFLVYIPGSKHLHVLTAAPNTYFRSLDIAKPMRKVVLDDENATSFGAAKVTDLSWKDTLDLYACTECGRCQDACPAHNTGKPLSPKRLIMDLKDNLYQNKMAALSGQTDNVGPILGDKITDDVIWACTSCRACEAACPVFIEQTDKIYEVRRNMVLMESRFPAELQTVFKNLENNFSPWAMSPEDRDKWTDGLKIKTMAEVIASGESIEYLFWVGCAGSFDDRNKKVSRALVNVMQKADVKFAILGKEEKCTGDPARRAGNEYLAQSLIQENVNVLNNYNVKKVVTACPHCFNAIKNEWKDFGGSFEVIHHTQLISELITSGRIKPNKTLSDGNITYHDSCYLGRWNGEYAAPRTILEKLPGAKLTETEKHSANALCCGAGGGRMFMEETIGVRVNEKRTEQLLATNAKTIAANCPFCITMMTDGVKSKDLVASVRVADIAELVEEALS